MLENIKSLYFIKLIFLNIKEKKKFELLRYNKSLQEVFNLDLISYIRNSNTYIIYESKGKGKEYDIFDDKLIYEGEYLNGKRNGKGKEFYKNGDLLFEGEYLNGKRWNGTSYFNSEERKEYILKNGQGYIKEYDVYNNSLIYEGEYLNGKRNGKGKEYKFGGLIFEGEYLNGKRWNGKVGSFNRFYEIKEGKGYIREHEHYYNHTFEGEYLDGKRNGKGKECVNGHLVYEGEYINGKRNGKGKEYDDIMYEGEFLNGKRNGNGKEYTFDKLIFDGEYFKGERNGKGKEYNYLNGGLIFEGTFLKGKRNGKGKDYNSVNGQVKFEGEYLNGERWNGKGKEFKNGKLTFEGEYINGEKIIPK